MDQLTFDDAPEPERWLPVVGFEPYYEVSDLGRVRSLHWRSRKNSPGGLILKSGKKHWGMERYAEKMATAEPCTKPGCDKPQFSGGLCSGHYKKRPRSHAQ